MRRATGVRRPVLLALVAALFATTFSVIGLTAPVAGGSAVAGANVEIRPIVFPVEGPVTYVDSFGAPRGSNRVHIGVDLMGQKLQKLLAATDATITWLRHDTVRGNNLELTDAEGWKYHYVHINNDSPGTDDGANPWEWAFIGNLKVGDRVVAGQPIAYLGDSGNAESTAPHLHFEIIRPDGTAINPTPSVRAAQGQPVPDPTVTPTPAPQPATSQVPPSAVKPFADFTTFVERLHTTYYGTAPTAAQRQAIASTLLADPAGMATVVATAVQDPRTDARLGRVLRLYESYFLRLPDAGGYHHWLDANAKGMELYPIAVFFAGSPEFRQRYGTLTNAQFVELVYRNVLGRGSDPSGRAYWLDRLNRGVLDRGGMMLAFSDSVELKSRTAHRLEAVAVRWLVDGSIPTAAQLADWQTRRAGGQSLASVISATVR